MPGQFINTGTNPGGKISLVNNNNAGNLVLSVAPAPPALILYLSTISGAFACSQSGPIFPLTSVIYNGGTGLCDSTSFDSPDVDPISGGTSYVSDGTNSRQVNKVPGAGITLMTFTGPCIPC
jgi:hypothetical protein